MSRLIGPGAFVLASKHCQEISRILKEVDACLCCRPALTAVPLKEIIQALFPSEVVAGLDSDLLCLEIDCDPSTLVAALRGFCGKVLSDLELQPMIRGGDNSNEVVLSLFTSGVKTSAESSGSGLSSLTEIALRLFDRGVLEACLAEAVLAAQGIRFDAEGASHGIRFNFYFSVYGRAQ